MFFEFFIDYLKLFYKKLNDKVRIFNYLYKVDKIVIFYIFLFLLLFILVWSCNIIFI